MHHSVQSAANQPTGTLRRHLTANVVVLGGILASLLAALWSGLPTITRHSFPMAQGVLLTDAGGGELYRFYRTDDRLDLPLNAFPAALRNAIVAIEDQRFYERSCIDIRAITRAAVANVFDFKSQGASTITQQLLRNEYDLREKTFARKILELSLSCKMELAVNKDGILELYLNHASFGGPSFGAQEASHAYFGKDVRDITLAESAVLAALLQRPTYFSPYGPHLKTTVAGNVIRQIRQGGIASAGQVPQESVTAGLIGDRIGPVYLSGRADDVLAAMLRRGTINNAQYEEAGLRLQTMRFAGRDYPVSTPYFPSLVQKELATVAGVGSDCRLLTSGCTITSTLDPALQAVAERIVQTNAPRIRDAFHAQNIALVAVQRSTREIVAYVGNVDFSDAESGLKIDMAQSPRQPGSSFKPFVYAAAFLQGYTPATFLLDAPLWVGTMNPQNYEGGYLGWTSVRHALAASRNIPAIRMFFMLGGEEPILRLASLAGIVRPQQVRDSMRGQSPGYWFGYPLAIGAAEVPLIQMVQGYTTLANSGSFLPLTSIREIRDGKDSTAYASADRGTPVQAMPPLVAREITSILSDSYFRPTPYWDKLLTLDGIESAVKTGTSNQCARVNLQTHACLETLPTDVWTLGYTPEYVVGVWVGNATYQPLTPDADGLNVASPLWKEFLQEAHALHPAAPVQFPDYSTFPKRAKTGFYAPPTPARKADGM